MATAAQEQAQALAYPPHPPDATTAYGKHPDQVVDLWRPRGTRHPAPLVLLVHGGAWREPYDRQHVSTLAGHLADQGFAVASAEYRRAGGAGGYPETFDDMARLVDDLPGLAARALPEADPERIVLTGHSAGGQLVLWAAARHRLPADSPWHRGTPPPVRGVVALAPIGDFAPAVRLQVCDDAVVELLGGQEHLVDRLPHTDPAALLPTGIPTTIVQGRTDIDVPFEVAEGFVRAAAEAGEEVRFVALDGCGHFPLIDPATGACSVVVEELRRAAAGSERRPDQPS